MVLGVVFKHEEHILRLLQLPVYHKGEISENGTVVIKQ